MILIATIRQLAMFVVVAFVVGIIASAALAAHSHHSSDPHGGGKAHTVSTPVCRASGNERRVIRYL